MTDFDGGEFAYSWLQRARVAAASNTGTSVSPDLVIRAAAPVASEGWDPWDVWLRRIDQPRRYFLARQLKLTE